MRVFVLKFKESLLSILPVVVIVLLLYLMEIFYVPIRELIVFLFCAFLLTVGLTLFNIGAELSMTPMGNYAGTGLVKTKKVIVILCFAFLLGFLITIAEPDLLVLSKQVKDAVNDTIFIIAVGLGVGLFLVIAVLKVIFNKQLSLLLMINYLLLFSLTALLVDMSKAKALGIIFDAGGVTTGPLTVPFIMSFGLGIASTIGGKNNNENSFGFVSLCSIGPILVVMLVFLFSNTDITISSTDYSMTSIFKYGILNVIFSEFIKVFRALLLIFVFFILLNYFIMKIPIKKIFKIFIGLIIIFIGLVIFLTTATIGFLPIGYSIGHQIIQFNKLFAIFVCFLIGFFVVLAEPAIQILTLQVENVTGATVSKTSMLIALATGVGFSLVLSIIRILFGFSVLYYLVPGYFLSLLLSLFVPPVYTAVAFDSGGVASGSLTSSFILPMMIGVSVSCLGQNSVMEYAFGIVSLVAMMPLISIQLLGFRAIIHKLIRDRLSMNRIMRADDNQIIYFEYYEK